ncbi:MAG: RNA exonuclease 3 [Phylliscum demangeonii]|nr:MAG: RNA exonuclease 3 [Phylliscum demangeonii]
MFSSDTPFGQERCPQRDQCVLSHCLYSHRPPSVDDQPIASPLDGAVESRRCKRRRDASPADAAIKKRTNGMVTVTVTAATDAAPAPAVPVAAPTASSAPRPAHRPSSISTSAARLVSPPPSRRAQKPPTALQKGQNARPATNGEAPVVSNGNVNANANAGANAHGEPATSEALNPRVVPRPPGAHAFRLKVVTMLLAQFARLNDENAGESPCGAAPILTAQELITMTLDEEEKLARDPPSIYNNDVRHRLSAVTKMKLPQWRELLGRRHGPPPDERGRPARAKSPSKEVQTGLTAAEELAVLPRLHASADALAKWGYITASPTAAELAEARQGVEAAHGWEQCDRCRKRFQVFPGRRPEDGALTGDDGDECRYHWGKAHTTSPGGQRHDPTETRYTCCNEDFPTAPACTTAAHHVFKASDVKRMALVLPFETTTEPATATAPPTAAHAHAALAMDCEMCYTVYGMELVRLTVVAWPSGDPVLDVLVRPAGEILDLNTRFSGVSAADLTRAEAYVADGDGPCHGHGPVAPTTLPIVSSPRAARALLLQHLGPHTTLVGHALENDLAATRLIHGAVVDSALLFPHRRGLPFRNGLRHLADRHLGRAIQQLGPAGHDSAEDARAAGDLVRVAVATEWRKMKRNGWRFADGAVLCPPKAKAKGR